MPKRQELGLARGPGGQREGIMKVRRTIAALSTAALVGGGALGFSAAASASTASHTLRFVSVEEKVIVYSKTSQAEQDKDTTNSGKLVGFDMLNFAFNPKTHKGTALAALDLKGGMLFAVLSVSLSSATSHGLITGGIGIFKGASGTIVAKNLNASGTRTAVTITYTT
jgi:hypothetical protein